MAARIGLYGGSFNPIHHGHLIIARTIVERLDLERVLFLPSATPPHKAAEQLVEPRHRAEMVRRAIRGEPGFMFSDFDLTRDGPSYTIDTARHFRQVFGRNTELLWIIGADSLVELSEWYEVAALIDLCRIVTAARPRSTWSELDRLRQVIGDGRMAKLSADILDTPMIDISSTDIRRRVRDGRSIRYLVPEAVRRYIQRHGLYAGAQPDARTGP